MLQRFQQEHSMLLLKNFLSKAMMQGDFSSLKYLGVANMTLSFAQTFAGLMAG